MSDPRRQHERDERWHHVIDPTHPDYRAILAALAEGRVQVATTWQHLPGASWPILGESSLVPIRPTPQEPTT